MKCFKCKKDITEDLDNGQIEIAIEKTGFQLHKIEQGTLRIFCSRGCREEWMKEQA